MSTLSVRAGDWVSAHYGYKYLGVTQHQFFKLVAARGVRTQALPGEQLKFWRADIERLRTELETR